MITLFPCNDYQLLFHINGSRCVHFHSVINITSSDSYVRKAVQKMGCNASCVANRKIRRLDDHQFYYLWDGKRSAFNAFNKSNSSCPHNRNKYVIVRKLYTEWIFEEENAFSLEKVYTAVKRYGEIEALEFIDVNKCLNKKVGAVYITFKYSLGAMRAYIAHRNTIFKCSPLLVSGTMFPMCAWHQPEMQTIMKNPFEPDPNPELCHTKILNDDCLLEIFKYLDLDTLITVSEVCERFKILLEQHVFPIKVEPTITINLGEFSLSTYRWSHCFARYVKNVKIVVECVNGTKFRKFIVESVAQLIASIFGNKIKELTVYLFDDCDPIDLEPILRRIEKLTIFSNQNMVNIGYKFEKLLRFQSKLKTFTFYFLSDFGANVSISAYERLIMLRLSEYMCWNRSEKSTLPPSREDFKLSDLFAANPKISCLQLSQLNSCVLEKIIKYLPNLEYLYLLKLPNSLGLLHDLETMKRFQCVEIVKRLQLHFNK